MFIILKVFSELGRIFELEGSFRGIGWVWMFFLECEESFCCVFFGLEFWKVICNCILIKLMNIK